MVGFWYDNMPIVRINENTDWLAKISRIEDFVKRLLNNNAAYIPCIYNIVGQAHITSKDGIHGTRYYYEVYLNYICGNALHYYQTQSFDYPYQNFQQIPNTNPHSAD